MPELVPQMKMLFPWLTICLDQSQVKSWCLSSRDAASNCRKLDMSRLPSEVGETKIGVGWGGQDGLDTI